MCTGRQRTWVARTAADSQHHKHHTTDRIGHGVSLYHAPPGRFSKPDCSTSKRGCQSGTIRLQIALGEVIFNADFFWHRHYSSCGHNRPRKIGPAGCDTRYTPSYTVRIPVQEAVSSWYWRTYSGPTSNPAPHYRVRTTRSIYYY